MVLLSEMKRIKQAIAEAASVKQVMDLYFSVGELCRGHMGTTVMRFNNLRTCKDFPMSNIALSLLE